VLTELFSQIKHLAPVQPVAVLMDEIDGLLGNHGSAGMVDGCLLLDTRW